MRRLGPKGILRLSVFSSVGYIALYLFVSVPDIMHGGEDMVIALLMVSAVGAFTFVGTLALGFLFLYKRPDLT